MPFSPGQEPARRSIAPDSSAVVPIASGGAATGARSSHTESMDRGAETPTRPRCVRTTRFAQHDVHVHGLRLRYIDVAPPSGATTVSLPLLMIHGLSSRIEEYEELVPRLAETRRVLV